MKRAASLVTTIVLVAAACSSSSTAVSGPDAVPTADTPTATTVADPGPTTAAVATPTATDLAPAESTPTETPAQPAVDTEPTPGTPDQPIAESESERLCTVNVGYDEVLNVRDEPSLDGWIVARVPGLSCAMRTMGATDLNAEWLPVVYETGHVQQVGFVSSAFVEVRRNEIEYTALEWMQAVLDGRDPAPYEYGPYLDEVDTGPLERHRGGTAVPYIAVSGDSCVILGDVTVGCAIQINDADHRPVAHVVVRATVRGVNGSDGEPYFPDDFGQLPLVTGYEECIPFDRCGEFEFGTIAIDSDASLAGVALGTPAEAALADLVVAFGPPTEDSGWVVGCPLDGEGANERYVAWGGLNVAFSRWDGPAGELWYWFYDFDPDVADPAIIDRIRLPGRQVGGASMAAISEAARIEIKPHEITGDPSLRGPGWTIFGDLEGLTVTRAAVPFIGLCD